MAEQFNLKKFLIDNKLTKSTQLRDGRFGLLNENIESTGEKMDKTQFKQKVKEMILKEIDLTHRKKEISEVEDPIMSQRIAEMVESLDDIKDEYTGAIENDSVWNHIDQAIEELKSMINSPDVLDEAKDDDEEVETEDKIEVTDEFEDTEGEDMDGEGLDPNLKSIQNSLTKALAAATQLGDEKLTDQIGNTITFFTRAHIVN